MYQSQYICFAVAVLGHLLSLTTAFLPHYESSFGNTRITKAVKTSLYSSSYNPNDDETPEERQARMELVRRIQANFYQSDETLNDENDDTRWLLADPENPTVLFNLPLWRVQWTELPGYQNVLNVHVAHYTHMFRKLLLEHPKPWYFGHVFLPGGSENLGNPEYFLPEKEPSDDDPIPSNEEEFERQARVTTTGTLMQVTDYMEQEDGRLTLVVQGVGRLQVLAASQQVPYAIASKVKLLSDRECWEQHVLRLVGTAPTDYELSMAYIDASQALAAKESELLRDLEFYQTVMEQHQMDGKTVTIGGVSPLSNVNGSVSVNFDEMKEKLQEAFSKRFSQKAAEYGSDDILLASTTLQLQDSPSLEEEEIVLNERDVWIKLDEMIRLLGKAQPGLRIPVPAQLLGLLPIDTDWPKDFRLEQYAEQLEDNQARVGTYSKSPFVRLSKAFPQYPPIRRASRCSYAVWLLIDTIAAVGGERFSREELLEISSISDRLTKTIQQLDVITEVIGGIIGKE